MEQQGAVMSKDPSGKLQHVLSSSASGWNLHVLGASDWEDIQMQCAALDEANLRISQLTLTFPESTGQGPIDSSHGLQPLYSFTADLVPESPKAGLLRGSGTTTTSCTSGRSKGIAPHCQKNSVSEVDIKVSRSRAGQQSSAEGNASSAARTDIWPPRMGRADPAYPGRVFRRVGNEPKNSGRGPLMRELSWGSRGRLSGNSPSGGSVMPASADYAPIMLTPDWSSGNCPMEPTVKITSRGWTQHGQASNICSANVSHQWYTIPTGPKLNLVGSGPDRQASGSLASMSSLDSSAADALLSNPWSPTTPRSLEDNGGTAGPSSREPCKAPQPNSGATKPHCAERSRQPGTLCGILAIRSSREAVMDGWSPQPAYPVESTVGVASCEDVEKRRQGSADEQRRSRGRELSLNAQLEFPPSRQPVEAPDQQSDGNKTLSSAAQQLRNVAENGSFRSRHTRAPSLFEPVVDEKQRLLHFAGDPVVERFGRAGDPVLRPRNRHRGRNVAAK